MLGGGSDESNATVALAGMKERYQVIFEIIQKTTQSSNI
jgi:hypothetical protein